MNQIKDEQIKSGNSLESISKIYQACREGKLCDLKQLLMQAPGAMESFVNHSLFPRDALRIACTSGQLEVVKYLLASPELTQHPDPKIALVNSIPYRHMEIVNFVLYDMNHVLTLADYEKEINKDNFDILSHCVEKRDLFFKLNTPGYLESMRVEAPTVPVKL